MNYDLAPMERITTYIYRTTYAKYYGGIDRYYTPFLASMHLSNRLTEYHAAVDALMREKPLQTDTFSVY